MSAEQVREVVAGDWGELAESQAALLARALPADGRGGPPRATLAARLLAIWQAASAAGDAVLVGVAGGARGSAVLRIAPAALGDYQEGILSDVVADRVEVVARLLAHARARCARAACAVLYVEATAWLDAVRRGLQACGWQASAVVVRRTVEDARPPGLPPAPLRLRPAEARDEAFVRGCLVEAHRRALSEQERRLCRPGALERLVAGLYAPLLAPDRVGLILEQDDAPVGHALLELEVPHRLTGLREARLVDVFILAEHEGRGLSRVLSAQALALCRLLGYPAVSGTVALADGGRGAEVLAALLGLGWREELRTWQTALA